VTVLPEAIASDAALAGGVAEALAFVATLPAKR
jgi:hypothetical protein